MESATLVPTCTECRALWLPGEDSRWRLYLGVDEDLYEQPELVWLCDECAAAEFD